MCCLTSWCPSSLCSDGTFSGRPTWPPYLKPTPHTSCLRLHPPSPLGVAFVSGKATFKLASSQILLCSLELLVFSGPPGHLADLFIHRKPRPFWAMRMLEETNAITSKIHTKRMGRYRSNRKRRGWHGKGNANICRVSQQKGLKCVLFPNFLGPTIH